VPLEGITRLAELALAMLDRALRAFTSRDTAEAKAICLADDQADVLYKQIFNGMVSYMVADPRRIGVGTHLLQIAHELERVADRATNIAERIIYTVTGELMELNV
jgi:phosphate transport system protein